MSVFGSKYHGVNNHGDPVSGDVTPLQNYPGCFGCFQYANIVGLVTPDSVKFTMLMKASQRNNDTDIREMTKRFMEGKFFRRLTGHQVFDVSEPTEYFFGANIREAMGRYTEHDDRVMLQVTFNPNFNSDRLISAFRIATQHWKHNSINQLRDIPEDLWEYIPLACAIMAGNGYGYSDGSVIFTRITAGDAREFQANGGDDDWGDIYYDDFADGFAHCVSKEGLAAIMGRTEEDFQELERPLNASLFRDGYIKDDELGQDELDQLEDHHALSINAPISFPFDGGGTSIAGMTIEDICNFLKQNDIQ